MENEARVSTENSHESGSEDSYGYGDGVKSGHKSTVDGKKGPVLFPPHSSVQMKVFGNLKGRQIESWKRFTVRGKAKWRKGLREWTYQLNNEDDGAQHKGDEYFAENLLQD